MHRFGIGDHGHAFIERIALAIQGQHFFACLRLALAAADRPVSAYDIADAVSQTRGKRVAPNSVYRILDLFVTTNLATRVESANAFIANAHPGCHHDCIFLVCQVCRQARHVDDDTLSTYLRERAAREGFTTQRPVIELLGVCANCA